MKSIFIFLIIGFFIVACSDSSSNESTDPPKSMVKKEKKADDGKGVGEIKVVKLTNPLEENMITRGKAISEMKCAACHRLTDQRVVGPGWKGVTKKRTPEWIMNMITNVDVMLEKDPAAQELLGQCLVRMPNQNVSIGDARDILEYMRFNDGEE